MQIVNYFESDNKEKLVEMLGTSDWGAAKFLVKLLQEGTFMSTLGGEGSLYMMLDDDKPVAFVTLTKQDCVADESMFPWAGFVFTYPQYRGNRYSEQIIKHALEEAKKQGHTKVYLATDHVGMYEKYGFVYLENRVDVWGDDSRIYYIEL